MQHRSGQLFRASFVLVLLIVCLPGCRSADSVASRREGSKIERIFAESEPEKASLFDRLSRPQEHAADKAFARARTAERSDDVEQAIRDYEEVLRHDEGRSDAVHRLAILYDRQDNTVKAMELFRKALAARPEDPDLLCDYGYSLYLGGQLAEADHMLRRALSLKPDMRRGHLNLGLVLCSGGHLNLGYGEFIRSGCTEADARNNLAFALTLQQRWNEAREQYEIALDADPMSVVAHNRLRELDRIVQKVHIQPQGSATGLAARAPREAAISTGHVGAPRVANVRRLPKATR